MSVAVVVMGDLGRSPRMLNHVEMILKHTLFDVDLVGCPGSQLRKEIGDSSRVKVNTLSSSFVDRLKQLPRAFFLIYAAFRILIETLQLCWIFGTIRKPKLALIQNPPNLPVLAVLILIAYIRQFPVCIDWHNYGFSILQVAHRPPWMVGLATHYERLVGCMADLHICVSQNLKEDLRNYSVKAKTLYDLPTHHFTPVTSCEEALRLKKILEVPLDSALVVSSTSWTPDEDFGILLDAIDEMDLWVKREVCFVITGKGPMKAYYAAEIAKRKWSKCMVKLAWLTAEDYPVLLGVADVGVCLHTSSSKLDLPMKVVDMHGAGLPVVAYAYPTIGELVTSDTGTTFVDSKDLSQKLGNLLENPELLTKFRTNLKDIRKHGTWETEWNRVFYPMLTSSTCNRTYIDTAFRALSCLAILKCACAVCYFT
mmetsp:Transcript_20922/g.38772  ORF Transcript_20922/g.38772 Transcript_20922/m.38772 type:complete len:425 (-) Transcript_20922:641-1915(-)